MKEKIIEYIKRNRVSTTEVADALNKTGLVTGVKALNPQKFKVGNIKWVYAYGETNWDVHKQVESVKEGDIVFVEVFDCNERAIFGDLVSKYLLLYKGAEAIVVQGNLRDAHRLIKEDWPIWCHGTSPIGCFNTRLEKTLDENIQVKQRGLYDGSIGVCDDSGVVIIPKSRHNEEFLERLEFIESQEDIWYDCLDRRKWSTFETVCLKKYLNDKENK